MTFFFLFLIFVVFALLLITAPITLPIFGYCFLQRRGLNSKIVVVVTLCVTSVILIWPLSGLYILSKKCNEPTLTRAYTEKLGSVSRLLVDDGIGRWWEDKSIKAIKYKMDHTGMYERNADGQLVRTAKQPSLKKPPPDIQYKISIELPRGGNFQNRYLAAGRILVQDRFTGKLIASVREPAWGGGIVGAFIASVTTYNPFFAFNRYLSCGYANKDIGVMRGSSPARRQQYGIADNNLVNQLFLRAQKE